MSGSAQWFALQVSDPTAISFAGMPAGDQFDTDQAGGRHVYTPGDQTLHRCDLDGGAPVLLVNDAPYTVLFPCIDQAAENFWYIRRRTSPAHSSLVRRDLDGTNPLTQYTSGSGWALQHFTVDWRDTGRAFAIELGPGPVWQVLSIDLTTGGSTLLLDTAGGPITGPTRCLIALHAWDGPKLYLIDGPGTGSYLTQPYQVHRLNRDGTGFQAGWYQLTTGDDDAIEDLTWDPQRDQIYLSQTYVRPTPAPEPAAPQRAGVYRFQPDGSGGTLLAQRTAAGFPLAPQTILRNLRLGRRFTALG